MKRKVPWTAEDDARLLKMVEKNSWRFDAGDGSGNAIKLYSQDAVRPKVNLRTMTRLARRVLKCATPPGGV